MEARDHELLLLLTPPHACAYLPDRDARDRIVHPPSRIDKRLYTRLAHAGFRRNGAWIYAPRCPACQACESARVPVGSFRPNRSQRRCLRDNRDLDVRSVPPTLTDEQYDLYLRYQRGRHPGGPMAEMGPEACQSFLSASWSDSCFVEYRDVAGRLVAFSAIDRLEDASSCVYTAFDPGDATRSPGTLAILDAIEVARSEGLRWVYLGYWIEGCEKMRYKTRFRPIELFRQGAWRLLE